MPVELKIVPGVSVTRQQFIETHPPYSIALDGYCRGEPFLATSPSGPFRNFNHHESVDRSCTSATCEQVRRAVILGLYDLFKSPTGANATIWVNDCDQDVCLATWILFHPQRAGEAWVRTLAYIEDLLDMSAGGFPMPDERDLLGEVRWVFEPYTGQRPNLAELNAQDMSDIIAEVHGRIERFLEGTSESLPLVGDYRRIGGGPNWVLVEIDHQNARRKMVEAGVRAGIELYGKNGERFLYAIWRRSEYIVDFPVVEILAELNAIEGLSEETGPAWGGAENVGGSPRNVGSKLVPAQVEAVVNRVIEKTRARYHFI